MGDLTIMYISASKMPKKWCDFQIKHLLHAAKKADIISITRERIDLGYNIVESNNKCYWNMYKQMLVAAKIAKTTYIAMAEDDTLYSREHFWEYRPDKDTVSYNKSRWSLFEWDSDFYCMRQRISNCTLIAPRELLIEALEERENKYPNGNSYVGEIGRKRVERKLGVINRKMKEWWSTVPVIQLNHRTGTDIGGGPKRTKRHGQIKAYNIPYWNKSKEIIKYYEYS